MDLLMSKITNLGFNRAPPDKRRKSSHTKGKGAGTAANPFNLDDDSSDEVVVIEAEAGMEVEWSVSQAASFRFSNFLQWLLL
jgi:hypothetical protein